MDSIGKTKEQKTYELVLGFFFDEIFTRHHKPNDKLPNVREISEKLKLNEYAVVEVLHIMEKNSMIRHVSADDTYSVCCDLKEYMHKAASIIMTINNLQYSEIITMRSSYEKTALDLAMQGITSAELEHMKNLLDGMKNTDNVKESAVFDVEFHKALMASSHSRVLQFYFEMVSEMQKCFIQSFHFEISKDNQNSEQLKEAHQDIYQALVERNYEKGWKALGNHFRVVGKYVDIIQAAEAGMQIVV